MTLLPPRWSIPKKLGFLFLTVYFFFLITDFTSSDELFPHFVYVLFTPLTSCWNRMVPWTGKHILHLSYPITVTPNGSGDTTFNYVLQLLWVVFALIIATIWTLADKKRPGYNQLYYWVRIVMRYYFAFILFVYGFIKIIKLQFPFPDLIRLSEPYGDSSPMGLAWTFIGYSKGYNIFIGGAEVLAGILLFFKRTTLAGALLALMVMTNVAAMNFAYDIPVKIYSLNLVLLAAFLVAPDFKRLTGVLFNMPAPPAQAAILLPATGRKKIIQCVLKVAAIGFALYATLWSNINMAEQYGDAAPKPPLYGIYKTEQFVLKGAELPPLTTDTVRWKQLIINYPGSVRITTMADSVKWLKLKLDTLQHTALFSSFDDDTDTFLLHYSLPDKEHLVFKGQLKNDSLVISTRRFDHTRYKLVNRGFHWINEYPYNR